MRRVQVVLLILVFSAAITACGVFGRDVRLVADPPAHIDQLWQEPLNLAQRDLFHGAGGESLAPPDTTFAFVARDDGGWSPGFDVRSRDGIEWSVKLGPEAQSEVVVSRILWAIGFHQPPTYYLDRWAMTGAESGPQPPGRFRPTTPSHTVVGEWSWYENPFVGTRPFGGLIVANLLLNSWDWKTSNNKIYDLEVPQNGVNRWFVVRDVGASLGKTTYPTLLKWFRLRGFGQGTRNDVADFEEQGFITHVDAESGPEFDYRGIYRDVIDEVTLADVHWACSLLNGLTDQQWRDAFRAAGYDDSVTQRYVRKIKSKISQGLSLTAG